MKKFTLIFSIIAIAMFSSCTSKVADDKKDVTLYATATDSTVVVYRHDVKEPIILKKPINVEELQKYAIPYSVIQNMGTNPGMRRYVDGTENDVYDVSPLIAIPLILFFTFGLFSGIIIEKNT